MTQDAVLRELMSLREDIGQMGGRLVSMRYDDFRQAFVEELALAAGEEGARSLDDHLSNVQGTADCEMRSACTVKLNEAVDLLADDLRRDDTEAARTVLAGMEGVLCGEGSPCQDDACSKAGLETIRRVKTILDVYERVRSRLQVGRDDSTPLKGSSPEGMEKILAPLANARRLEALSSLAGEDLSLSDLARRLGIRTGHLQYHVRVLREAGLITTVKGRRLYSITPKGKAALGLAESMTSSLARAPA